MSGIDDLLDDLLNDLPETSGSEPIYIEPTSHRHVFKDNMTGCYRIDVINCSQIEFYGNKGFATAKRVADFLSNEGEKIL